MFDLNLIMRKQAANKSKLRAIPQNRWPGLKSVNVVKDKKIEELKEAIDMHHP